MDNNSNHIMARHIKFWYLCALWAWPPKLGILQTFYSLFLLSLVLFVVVCISMYLFVADNFFDFAKALNPVLISAPCIIKAILFIINKHHVVDLLKIMNELNQISNSEEQEIMTRATKQSKFIFVAFGCVCYSYLILVSVAALVQPGRVLLFSALIPFRWQQSDFLYYTVAIIPQMAAVLVVVTFLTTLDTYGPTFYLNICAYFNIFGLRLSKLGHSEELEHLTKNEYFQRNEEKLRNCIIYYNLCLK